MRSDIQQDFIKYLVLQSRCTLQSVKQYLYHIDRYEQTAARLGIPDVLKIETYPEAWNILLELQRSGNSFTGKPLSDSYTAKIAYMVSSYWEFACLWGLKEKNPFANGCGIKKPQFARREYLDRDSEKMRQILSYPWTARDRALMYILYSSAARRAEAVNVMISDVYQETYNDRGIVHVIPFIRIYKGKGGKTREIPITEQAYEHIQDYITSLRLHGYEGNHLFPSRVPGRPIKPDTCYRIVRKVGARLGFRLTPHVLRHSFAASAIEKGNDISVVADWMGHEDIKTTKIYTHHTKRFLGLQYKRTMETA